MIRLHDYWRSSASYRVRIALALKGVAYERIAVDLLAGDQASAANRARNPLGFVPTLEVEGVPLIESLAIIDWLDQAYPEPRLIPAEPLARARAMAMALAIAADIHPIGNLRVLRYLEQKLGADAAARKAWYRHWVAEGFAALEAMAEAGDSPFLGGAAPNVADLCLVPQMYNARRFEAPLDCYPRLLAADAAAQALPGFQAAHPDQVKPG